MLPRFLLVLLCLNHVADGRKISSSSSEGLKESTIQKINTGKPLNRHEKQQVERMEHEKYIQLRNRGWNDVGHTRESHALRNYRLRKRKRIGLFKKRQASLSQIFFPNSLPNTYHPHQPAVVVGNLMRSKKNLALYDIVANHPAFGNLTTSTPTTIQVPLGAKLEGYKAYQSLSNILDFKVQKDLGCTPIMTMELSVGQHYFLRRLIRNRYRMHLVLDDLPVLMRSQEFNYAVKGFPIGFEAVPSFGKEGCSYLYNHWKFIVTYQHQQDEGIRITGFDVYPVSNARTSEFCDGRSIPTSHGNPPLINDPSTCVCLHYLQDHPDNHIKITFSYEVEWIESDLPWEDRWDVYFLGLPDDAIHYFSMLNSVICMIILAALLAVALMRVFRKDLLGGAKKENGWKHLQRDVFRPPSSPLLLSVMVGNGLHLLVAAIITMLLNVCHVINTMKAGEALTGLLFCYSATGSLGGYASARLYKLFGGENFQWNAIVTSTALSGSMVILFGLFNMVATAMGSSSSDVLSTVKLILLWGCLVGLTYWGSWLGEKAPCISIPTETSDTVRPIPESRWTKYKKLSALACGMLCFGVLYVELHFLMAAIWLQVNYLGLGYILTVTLMATIVCAECTICVCYFQLNSDDHDWWWTAFQNGAAVAGYMTIYSLFYNVDRIDLEGIYSNVSYFTCMFVATICIGMVCGSIGLLSCLWFTRIIYSAIDLDDDDDEEDEEIVPLTKDTSESSEVIEPQ